MIARYSVYVANLLSMMMLARVFTPDEFGTVAAIMVFFVFFQMMAEAGLGPAIINIDRLATTDRDGLFGLTIVLGVLLAVCFGLLGPVLAAFYGIPRVGDVVPYVAVSVLFFAASIVPNAFLLREQAFFQIAKAGVAGEFLSTVGAMLLSLVVDPLYALSSKAALNAATMFGVAWYLSSSTQFGRPIPGARFSAIQPLIGFSSYQFGFNFINYFSRNLDNILVGKYMGAPTLGMYDKAYQLMKYPLLMLTFAMTPAIQPVVRKYAGDRLKVEQIHRDFTFKLSLVGAAAGLTIFVLADWIVFVALGDQWENVVPLMRILAIGIPVQVVLSTSGSFFQGMNRADLLFVSGVLSAVVIVAAIVAGIISRDIEHLCWLLVGAFHISFLQTYYLMYKSVFRASLRWHLVRMIPAATVVLGMVLSY